MGWLDALPPYGEPNLRALVPFVLVPVLLAGAAVVCARDATLGGALLRDRGGARAHLRLLGESDGVRLAEQPRACWWPGPSASARTRR